MTLAAVFRKFGKRLQVYETTAEDVEIHRDIFVLCSCSKSGE